MSQAVCFSGLSFICHVSYILYSDYMKSDISLVDIIMFKKTHIQRTILTEPQKNKKNMQMSTKHVHSCFPSTCICAVHVKPCGAFMVVTVLTFIAKCRGDMTVLCTSKYFHITCLVYRCAYSSSPHLKKKL